MLLAPLYGHQAELGRDYPLIALSEFPRPPLTARGDQAGHGVPRRQHDPGPPESGWCRQKGGSSAQRDQREALGRSRGGFSTKACVIADGSGRAIGFALAPGQANELPMAPVLLRFLTALALWIVADRGYASHAFRMLIWDLGSRPAIPTKRNQAPVACPPWIYTNRNLVERCWSRLKEWRAVATRYEKTERSFMGVLCMAATMDWLKA
jgi:transposase